jgi:hypothetical protein
MKKIILSLLFLFVLTFNLNAQTNTLSEARRLIQLQKQELFNAKEENKRLSSSLNDALTKINQGQLHIQDVQFAADNLKQWGLEQQNEAMNNFNVMMKEKKEKENEISLKEKAIKKYHFCKLINCIVASVLGLMLGLSMMKYIPPTHTQYALLLPLLTVSVSFCLIWFLL